VLILALSAMAFAGLKLWEIRRSDTESRESYKQLAAEARPGGQPEADNCPIDFTALQAVNPDAVAWLHSPGTVIDYPVMRAKDYNQYLRHLPDGTYNSNGSLFIDFNCAPDFSDSLTVIYGHNMRSGQMFGSLAGYKEQAYYQAHPYLTLYTEKKETRRIDLLYGCVIDAKEWQERAFSYQVNLDALLDYAAYNTTFTSGMEYTPGDQIVALSTCSYEFDGARYVVVGALRPA